MDKNKYKNYLNYAYSLKEYFIEIFDKCEFNKRNYIIFDQLNPSFSKYFKKSELQQTLKSGGFKILNIRHRHKYIL